jgi:glutamine amidotransferase
MIVIVDYGMGNLRSIQHKLQKIDIKAVVSSQVDDLEQATLLILPGVGHFGAGMNNLRQSNLLAVLNQKVLEQKVPIMGICLGMQLLTEWSEEGNSEGLGWLRAKTKKFRFPEDKAAPRIPHVGWNTIIPTGDSELLAGVGSDQRFYFTHSYYVECEEEAVLATTNYGYDFVSVVHKENIFGTQFHPEKSHRRGIELIRNFVRTMKC